VPEEMGLHVLQKIPPLFPHGHPENTRFDIKIRDANSKISKLSRAEKPAS